MNFFQFGLVLISFLISLVLGNMAIPYLKALKCSQTVREDGPSSHIKKNGTPTIGGTIFILPTILMSLLLFGFNLRQLYPILALSLFAIIGFADDILKIRRGKNLGLTAKEKMISLFIAALFLSYLAKYMFGTTILIPFLKIEADLNVLYIPFVILVYLGASNAVNLTDGLDGLAATVSAYALIFMYIITCLLGCVENSSIIAIAIGSIAGFLRFNIHPAKVFMGDTGSLAIGGFLAALSLQIKNPLILLIVGIIYILETFSVILQVLSFKIRRKRIFLMSPIHHHYELKGLSENKIVILFSLITMIFGILAIISL